MISAQLRELEARRLQLVALGAQHRAALARAFDAWAEPIALIDRGIAVWNYVRARPLLLAAGMALVVLLKRRHAIAWMPGAIAAWRLYRRAR
jgi:hypothetical protein